MSNSVKSEKAWVSVIRRFNKPDSWKSAWQIANSLGPYVILWILMYYSLGISFWITLGLAPLAAGFLIRIFIIFHDCGHGSFFRSAKANRIVGTILGSLVFTPHDRWHKDHAIHHSTVGNLDKRGVGDVWTLTVAEYKALSGWNKFVYRLYRHPLFLFVLAPVLLFVVWFRFPKKGLTTKEKWNLQLSNLIILVLSGVAIFFMGWKAFLMIQIPVIVIATSVGTWLFYVQHQFEEVIWSRQGEWSYEEMALKGSSFLHFPKVLQWFSGNIGFHHIHHLSPRIPNYNLETCHKSDSMFGEVKPVTFRDGLVSMKYRLWDELNGQLISFRQFRRSYAG